MKPKQAKISNMFKAAPTKVSKKKKDNNIQMFNAKGFGEWLGLSFLEHCSHALLQSSVVCRKIRVLGQLHCLT